MTSLRHTPPAPGSPDAYLDAARAAILDLGWRRTTLTEVARRAGVSRMTIYRTWPDMPTLLGDLMTREWAQTVAAALERAEPSADPAARIAAEITATVRALRDNELLVRILEVDPELLLPYVLSRRGRSQQAILDVLESQIRAGQADGRLRAGDPAAMARALELTAHGFVLSAQTMTDDGLDLDALDAELRLLTERSLRP